MDNCELARSSEEERRVDAKALIAKKDAISCEKLWGAASRL